MGLVQPGVAQEVDDDAMVMEFNSTKNKEVKWSVCVCRQVIGCVEEDELAFLRRN